MSLLEDILNFRREHEDHVNKSLGFEKAGRDTSKLVKQEKWVTRGGKTFKQTVWVKVGDEEKEQITPVGEELSPEVKGMNIKKYSDKAVLISGDTKTNVETLRDIKKELGVGTFNRKLNGWVFPIKFIDTVLGFLWSSEASKGNDEKAQAIQNQKNAGIEVGGETSLQGEKATVEENTSDSEGIKYNVKLKDGTTLENVDEKTLETKPETDDSKISEIVNSANESNRVKTEKKLYGIKPISNIHNYSLREYMSMHGISDEDIQKALNSLKKKKEDGGSKKRSSGTSSSGKKSDPNQIEGLSKRQIIGKLLYRHYNAVKEAVERGDEIKKEILETYSDLQEAYSKKRKGMSEETKRKISEALKGRGKGDTEDYNETSQAKQEEETVKDRSGKFVDPKTYKPKIEKTAIIIDGNSVSFDVKNYLDIPAIEISLMKQSDTTKKDKPFFIPDVNEDKLTRDGYKFSSFKIAEDKYLVALGGYHRDDKESHRYGYSGYEKIEVSNDFAYMTLDQLAATESYYQRKAKQEQKEADDKKLKDNEQKLLDRGYTKEEAKEKAKKWTKKSRVKIAKDTESVRSNFNLYSDMKETTEGVTNLSRNEKWEIHSELRAEIKQKALDLGMQQEENDSAFTKGRQTAYSNSGTKDDLLDKFGVKVKRQNGDEINKSEIAQIEDSLNIISNLFGNNVQMNKEFDLKISHSGEKRMHASKAIGIFFPFYKTIGVSEAFGKENFKFTFGHEYAHFMDYWIGKSTGNHYASDKPGSTANKIASEFRKGMNQVSESDYINRTCECFARALEQYTAIETYGKDVNKFENKYVNAGEQVNYDTYQTKIKPLIEQFLRENKDILKSFISNFFK